MEAFQVALNAVVPYLIYLLLGYLFRKWHLIDEPFYHQLNHVIFQAFYPITMFYNTHQISLELKKSMLLIGVCSGILMGIVLVSVIIVPMMERDNRRRGVIIQCLNRSNIVLYATGMAESLFGASGLASVSIIIAVFVPIYNVLAIIVLEYYRGEKPSLIQLGNKIIKNPLFLGAMIGICFSIIHIQLPIYIESTIAKVSAMTTPLAIMILGGTIHLESIRKNLTVIIATIFGKMIIIPAIAVLVANYFKLSALDTFICFIVFGTPISANAYTMSQNMGGDGTLAGELVAISTIFSLISLFAWIFLLRQLGII